VEEAPVAQPGQRVGVGEAPRLAVAERVVECRHAPAGDVRELSVERAEVASRGRDDCERAEGAELASQLQGVLRATLAGPLGLLLRHPGRLHERSLLVSLQRQDGGVDAVQCERLVEHTRDDVVEIQRSRQLGPVRAGSSRVLLELAIPPQQQQDDQGED